MFRRFLAAAVAGAALLTAACEARDGSGAPAASAGLSPSPPTSAASPTRVAAARAPSASAKMICESEAEDEIAEAVGVRPSRPPSPTWADELYSCRYVYHAAVLVLSVKELPDAAGTDAYFTATRNSLAGHVDTTVLDQAAFTGPDGSVFVRKDNRVLRVDVAGLPARFGDPSRTRAELGLTVAAVIMTCWTGG